MPEAGQWIIENGLRLNAEQRETSVMVTDCKGVILFVNRAFTSMTGYSEQDAVGRTPALLRSGRQTQQFYQQLWTTILSGQEWEGELVNRRKDGILYTQATRIAPIPAVDGGIGGFVASTRDLSGWRAAEEARHFLAAVVESSADAILTYSRAGIVLTWNRAATKLFGYTAEQMIGRPVTLVVAPERRASLVEYTGVIVGDGEELHTDGIGLCKDGTRVELAVTASAVRDADGEVSAISLIIRDITQQQEAERAQALLASVVECSEDAIFAMDRLGNVTTWNRGAEQLLGFTAAEMAGRNVSTILAAGLDEHTRELQQQIAKGQRVPAFDQRVLSRDGRWVWVSASISPIRDSRGELLGSCAILRDIGTRMAAEQKMRDSEERFRTAIAHAPFGIGVAGIEGNWQLVNPAFCRMLGYSEQ